MNQSSPRPGPTPDPATAQAFRAIADVVYAEHDYTRVYAAICAAAPQVVEGCDHASLLLREGRRLRTAAASDDVASRIDTFEQELSEGPCVDAIAEDAPYVEAALVDGGRWPRLADRVVRETPVRGMAGVRLYLGEDRTGALNLFSNRGGALTEQSMHEGLVLASFVSVSVLAAQERQHARTLRDGLASNREIGKAVGLMMAFHGIDDEEAFGLLRKASQDLNLKLAEVAREVVQHHNRR
jgi:hypothetical protein